MIWIVLLVYFAAPSIAQNDTTITTATAPSTSPINNITVTTYRPTKSTKNTTTAIPSTTSSSTTYNTTPDPGDNDDEDEPRPIQVRITPNITVFRGNGTLKCSIHGINLKRIMPYELCWEFHDKRNKTMECPTNARSILFDNNQFPKMIGSIIYCAVKFKRRENFFWLLRSHYVAIRKPKRGTGMELTSAVTGISSHVNDRGYKKHGVIIVITVVVIVIIVIGVTSGLLYRRRRKSNIKPPAAIEDLSSTGHDNIYSYVPLETVSFYKAKELAALNQKNDMKSIKPPPLPKRPQTVIEDDEEYIYSYAYGIKVNT